MGGGHRGTVQTVPFGYGSAPAIVPGGVEPDEPAVIQGDIPGVGGVKTSVVLHVSRDIATAVAREMGEHRRRLRVAVADGTVVFQREIGLLRIFAVDRSIVEAADQGVVDRADALPLAHVGEIPGFPFHLLYEGVLDIDGHLVLQRDIHGVAAADDRGLPEVKGAELGGGSLYRKSIIHFARSQDTPDGTWTLKEPARIKRTYCQTGRAPARKAGCR